MAWGPLGSAQQETEAQSLGEGCPGEGVGTVKAVWPECREQKNALHPEGKTGSFLRLQADKGPGGRARAVQSWGSTTLYRHQTPRPPRSWSVGRGQPVLPGPAHPLGAPVWAWGWGAQGWPDAAGRDGVPEGVGWKEAATPAGLRAAAMRSWFNLCER